MDFLVIFFGQDNSSYSMTMIIIYILVIIMAFALCVLISHKLNIYSYKMHKTMNNGMCEIAVGESDNGRNKTTGGYIRGLKIFTGLKDIRGLKDIKDLKDIRGLNDEW